MILYRISSVTNKQNKSVKLFCEVCIGIIKTHEEEVKKILFFCFQGHHFMVATLPAPPYITEMIPAGFTADGSMKYRINGFFAEVFDNLQVSSSSKGQNQSSFDSIYGLFLTTSSDHPVPRIASLAFILK